MALLKTKSRYYFDDQNRAKVIELNRVLNQLIPLLQYDPNRRAHWLRKSQSMLETGDPSGIKLILRHCRPKKKSLLEHLLPGDQEDGLMRKAYTLAKSFR